VVAEFNPTRGGSFPKASSAIRVYRDGTIESKFGNGSIVGATARVDQAGSQRIYRDTRQTFLTIEGPQVAISVGLKSNVRRPVESARKFAAEVNQLAQQLAPTAAVPSAASLGEASIPGQINQLADLRDKGILSNEEFKAKKTELLRRM
jgi:hypothetical protein